MPKNKGKGGKKFKKFKKGNANQRQDFVFKQSHEHYGQQYAKVKKMLGHGRLNAVCEDGVTRLCSISGKLKKRKTNGFIVSGDIILICVRPFNNKLADVIHKYSKNEVQFILEGNVPISFTFKNIIFDVGSSKTDDIVFDYTNNNISDDSSDDLDIGLNNNRQIHIEYSDVESDDSDTDNIDNINGTNNYGKKKSNIIDKRIKTKDKRDRRNNWKKNYENSRENDVKIDDI